MNTLRKIATAINNHIAAGLKQTNNEPFSIEQLEDEVIAERNRIIKQLEMSGKLDLRSLIQPINCLPVDCDNLSLCCGIETYDKKLHFKIPKLSTFTTSPIKFIGLTDRSKEFRFSIGGTWQNQTGGRYTKHLPYVWIASNLQDGFIFNPPTDNIKMISIDAVWETPSDLVPYACCETDIDTGIPQWMASEIIDKLTIRFAQNYYRTNYRPNDQTGH